MKAIDYIKTAALILGAALAHILPALMIVMIATEPSELGRCLATATLFCSTLALGYIHGINRSFSKI